MASTTKSTNVTPTNENVTSQKKSTSGVTETILLATGKTTEFGLKLGQLVALNDTYIPGAKDAMRNINKAHLENLILTDAKLPAITVQNSNQGYIILDGYHRYYRAIALARVAFHKPDQNAEDFDLITYLRNLPPVQNDEQAFIDEQKITVLAISCKNTAEMLQKAYTANFTHGLPADKTARAKYGWFLFDTRKANGVKTSIRACAKDAGCTHVAMIDYRDSKKRKTENVSIAIKEIESNTSLSDVQKAEKISEIKQKQEVESLEKHLSILATRMKSAFPLINKMEEHEAISYLTEFFKNEDGDMVYTMSQLLAEVANNLFDASDNEESDESEEETEEE